ncbi:CLUMA_CG016312, isoform A [Clunio marinus]|uniref:CLUMA_CG016312, isoform A n=1 Tax=Clunio marinus TaxID=568069 RepID=A0A1J1IXN2_9DIPT|nr:CLUMA_CG016312, isoform A [Clunio marinus]
MSFYFWFFFFLVPLFLVIILFGANRRRQRLNGRVIQPIANPVVYTVPTAVYVQPVHNNFPNTRHVAPSTLMVEQRLNQHYHNQQQPPPPYNTSNPTQRY